MVLGVSRIIVLLVALFSISGALNLSVLERLREIGTLRAFGNRRGQVIRLLLAEGLFLGLLGALAGTLAGWLLTSAANAAGGLQMPPQPGMSAAFNILFTPDPAHYLANGLWVTLAAVAGAWFPAHMATRRTPADLLSSV
jgi:putative ABC transport system permease protein